MFGNIYGTFRTFSRIDSFPLGKVEVQSKAELDKNVKSHKLVFKKRPKKCLVLS